MQHPYIPFNPEIVIYRAKIRKEEERKTIDLPDLLSDAVRAVFFRRGSAGRTGIQNFCQLG